MSNDALIILLKMVAVNGSLRPLREKGYTHSQIAMFLQKAIQSKLVEVRDDIIQLTNDGKQMLQDFYIESNLKGSQKWIMHQEAYFVAPIKKYDIVFPKKI